MFSISPSCATAGISEDFVCSYVCLKRSRSLRPEGEDCYRRAGSLLPSLLKGSSVHSPGSGSLVCTVGSSLFEDVSCCCVLSLMPRCLVNNPAGLYFFVCDLLYSYLHRIVLSQRALIMVILGTVCCSLTSAGKAGSVERTEALK